MGLDKERNEMPLHREPGFGTTTPPETWGAHTPLLAWSPFSRGMGLRAATWDARPWWFGRHRRAPPPDRGRAPWALGWRMSGSGASQHAVSRSPGPGGAGRKRRRLYWYTPRPQPPFGPSFQEDLDPSARLPAPGQEERTQAGPVYRGEPPCLGWMPSRTTYQLCDYG